MSVGKHVSAVDEDSDEADGSFSPGGVQIEAFDSDRRVHPRYFLVPGASSGRKTPAANEHRKRDDCSLLRWRLLSFKRGS